MIYVYLGEDYLALQELSEGGSPEIFRYGVVPLQSWRETQGTGKQTQKQRAGGTHAKGDVLSPAIFPSMALIGNLL